MEAFSLKKFLRPAIDLKIWGFGLIFLYALHSSLTSLNTNKP